MRRDLQAREQRELQSSAVLLRSVKERMDSEDGGREHAHISNEPLSKLVSFNEEKIADLRNDISKLSPWKKIELDSTFTRTKMNRSRIRAVIANWEWCGMFWHSFGYWNDCMALVTFIQFTVLNVMIAKIVSSYKTVTLYYL